MMIPDTRKKFEKIAFFSDILNVLLTLITIPITFVLYYVLKDGDFTYLQSLNFNWKSYPISTMTNLSFQKGKCSETESQIIFDFWAGTVRGCDCAEQLYVKGNALTRGYCSRKQSGCATIPSTSASPYLFWKSKMLCKNTNQGAKTYFDWVIAESAGGCPQNYKSCGVLDSLGNFMCVDVNEQCPVNYVKFISNAELNMNANSNGNNTNGNIVNNVFINSTNPISGGNSAKNYFNSNPGMLKDFTGYVDLEDGILAYSNIYNQNPILVQFKISEGQPCAIPFFDNSRVPRFYLESNFFQSKCYRTKRNITQLSFDSRYFYIDTISKYNLYKQNGILKSFDYFRNKTGLKMEIPDFNNNFIVTYPDAKAQTSYTFSSPNSDSSPTNNNNNNSDNNNNNAKSMIDNYYISYLYNFDFSFSHKIDLYARNFIGLKKRCFDEIKARNLQEAMLFHVSKVPIYFAISSDIAYYLTLAALSIGTYNLVVYVVFYCLKKTVDQPDVVVYFDRFKFKVLIILFPLLIEVVIIALISYIRSIKNTDETPLAYLNNPECVDSLTYENLSDLYKRIKDVNRLTFAIGTTIGISAINTVGFVALKVLKVINEE